MENSMFIREFYDKNNNLVPNPGYVHLRRLSTYNQRQYALAEKIADLLESEIIKTGGKYAVLKMRLREQHAKDIKWFISHHLREKAFVDRLSKFSLELNNYYKGNMILFEDQVWFISCQGDAWKDHLRLFLDIVDNMMPAYHSLYTANRS